MSEKSLTPHADSPHPKQPYKALRMRARSPEPIGRKLKKTQAAKKPPYKALLIRARSPKPFQENSTDSEASNSKDLEVPRKNSSTKERRISNKKNSSKGTMSQELDVTQTVRESHNNRGSKKNNSDEDIMSDVSEAEISKEEA